MTWRSRDIGRSSVECQQSDWELVDEDGRGWKGWHCGDGLPSQLRKRTKPSLKVSDLQALIFMGDSNFVTSTGRVTLECKQLKSYLEDVGVHFLIQVLDRSAGWYTAGSAVYYQQLPGDQMINGSLGYADCEIVDTKILMELKKESSWA